MYGSLPTYTSGFDRVVELREFRLLCVRYTANVHENSCKICLISISSPFSGILLRFDYIHLIFPIAKLESQ